MLDRSSLRRWVLASGCLLTASQAHAVPAYVRQTGNDCTACHVGGIGPQLTPYGTKFKIGGYTEGKNTLPLSAMAIAGFTHTDQGQPGGANTPHYGKNDNTTLNEASVFVAGKLYGDLGSFTQVTYSGIDRRWSWDQLDLRLAHSFDRNNPNGETVLGLSLNNNPGTQDPWNTLPQWQFPYTASELTPGYLGDPLLAGGIGTQVLGLTAYTFLTDFLYLEGGAYRGLSNGTLGRLGVKSADRVLLRGPAPYWRVNLGREFNRQYLAAGAFMLNASVTPDPTLPPDKFHDLGLDFTWQYLGTRKHIFSLYGRYVRERQALYGTYGSGGADSLGQGLSSFLVNGSYYFRNTWGLTLGGFGTSGTADATMYGTGDLSGSRTGAPNTQGYIVQADWTPTGKESSAFPHWLNFRLGLQYTGYTKFDGSSRNYDGNGRGASANNTLFVFFWTAF